MYPLIQHKRGDTIAWTCVRVDSAGDAVDITSTTIACKMRKGTAVLALTATKTDAANGVFTLSATAAATAALEVGRWECDVQYTDGSTVASDQTFIVEIIEDVTYDD